MEYGGEVEVNLLDQWLGHGMRDPAYYSDFSVIDIIETCTVSQDVKNHLVDLLLTSMMDPALARAAETRLGWRSRSAMIASRVPTDEKVRRGDFGEVLASAILEQFHGYLTPLKKLRHKPTGNQTLRATDVLALKLSSDGSLAEVCFVECKLRTARDNMVAVDASKQLKEDYDSNYPSILTFMMEELLKQGEDDPTFLAFCSYLEDRQDNRNKDSYRLSLCFERSEWRELVLTNLDESSATLPELLVHVVLIGELRRFTNELFSRVGIQDILDED